MEFLVAIFILWAIFDYIKDKIKSSNDKNIDQDNLKNNKHFEVLKETIEDKTGSNLDELDTALNIDNKQIILNTNTSKTLTYIDKYNIEYIYHMTHVNNLQNILQYGLLSHNNSVVTNKIDNPEVNSRRNFNDPIYNKNVHSYVPFYFNPKNAMLYVNKENQGNLIILVFDANLIYDKGSLFTDGNASANGTKFYNDINNLDKLDWNCINTKYWNDIEDGKRKRMSEVLVSDIVNIDKLKKIYCINYHIKNYIDNIIKNYPNIQVEVNTEIFF